MPDPRPDPRPESGYDAPAPTPATIDFHCRRARALQAAHLAGLFARLFRRRQPAAAAPAIPPDLAHEVVDALTAIRTTAEMLRDHPEIDPGERRRFLGVVLHEEARLEGLLPPALAVLNGMGAGAAKGAA